MERVTLFNSDSAGTLNGTMFRKQIVRFGDWVDPFDPRSVMTLDAAWAKEIVKNFNAKVIDRVPVPRNHTDDVNANTGELIKLEVGSDGLYGYLDIRDPKTVSDIENGLIFDNSISWDPDYVDTETGKHWGPVMLHVALVNNPYLTHMKPFEVATNLASSFANKVLETLHLAAGKSGAIMLSESKVKELNDMKLSKITNEKDYPVTVSVKGDDGVAVEKELAAGEEVEVPEEQVDAVKKQIDEAVNPDGSDDNDDNKDGDGDNDNDGDGDGDNADGKEELSRANAKIAKLEAEQAYERLLSAGKILPAQKSAFMALAKLGATTGKVQLSKDAKPMSLSGAITAILEAGTGYINFDENGSGKGKADDEAAKRPSEKLSKEESTGLQAVGVKPERMDELAEKYPEMNQTLESLDNRGDK